MSQLKMVWLPQPIKDYPVPEGCCARLFNSSESDVEAWFNICRNGLLGEDEVLPGAFEKRILNCNGANAQTDLFFVELDGKPVATITAIFRPENREGYVHMVAALPECRGRGIGNYMNSVALKKIAPQGAAYVYLTTDDFRKAAVKSYLNAGFLPVDYEEGMRERWAALAAEFGIKKLDMLNKNREHIEPVLL